MCVLIDALKGPASMKKSHPISLHLSLHVIALQGFMHSETECNRQRLQSFKPSTLACRRLQLLPYAPCMHTAQCAIAPSNVLLLAIAALVLANDCISPSD